MRVAAISDTHGINGWKVPTCDVLVHAGDMTGAGTFRETQRFAEWLAVLMASQDGPKYVVLVPGNHDACFEERLSEVRALFGPRVYVLIDEAVTLDGVTFYGSPWTPPFRNWHFMKPEADLGVIYGSIPVRVDVLVTHGPPAGVLDPGHEQPHAGSSALWQAVSGRRVQHHVFGHLHAAGGMMLEDEETCFYNVAACDDNYRLCREARSFEVEHAGRVSLRKATSVGEDRLQLAVELSDLPIDVAAFRDRLASLLAPLGATVTTYGAVAQRDRTLGAGSAE